jgi:hypothetical protein
MFKSLVAAMILASGLTLGAAPASAHDWGDRDDEGYSQGQDYDRRPDPRMWDRHGHEGPHWGAVQYDNGWRWRPHRHHHWRDWERDQDDEADPS